MSTSTETRATASVHRTKPAGPASSPTSLPRCRARSRGQEAGRTMHADSLTLAVDLGGTRMRAALVASDGTIVHRHQQRTPRGSPCPDALESLVRHVRDHGSPGRAVVGVPGRVDYDSGRLEYAPNLPPGWAEAIFTAHL